MPSEMNHTKMIPNKFLKLVSFFKGMKHDLIVWKQKCESELLSANFLVLSKQIKLSLYNFACLRKKGMRLILHASA